ncbi:hypothetical protein SESBI_43106 [Sesbania bispinosa]|nr:hypothetical protein SESBI_43106 [Sesbania bispinosa]
MSGLSALEKLDVDLLQSYYPMSYAILIEKEGNVEVIRPYIVNMATKNDSFVPQMDDKAMKAFSRAGKRKQGDQTSEIIPNAVLVDGDNEVAFLGHALESGVALLEKELKEKTQKLKEQEDELVRAQEAKTELEKVRGDLQRVLLEKEGHPNDLTTVKKEKEKVDTLLKQQTKSLETAEKALEVEKVERKTEVDNLKAEITFQYEQGFNKAIEQVKFLHPNINVE